MTPSNIDRSSALTRFSLDRRITVLVLVASLLVLGAVAILSITLELFPQGYDDPFLTIIVPWRDAPAPEVLDKITRPMEEELATVGGIQRISSRSMRGRSRIFMSFKANTDMSAAYREASDRIERARLRLPDDVERVYIFKQDSSGIPVFVLGLAMDEDMANAYDLIQNQIVLPLSRIEGVASVDTDGLVEKEIMIELDRERTAAAGLNIFQLSQELTRDNFALASGRVYNGGQKLLLRSIAQYEDLEALRRRPVAEGVYLGDIAVISYRVPKVDFRIRAMSRPAIAAVIFKEGEANAIEVAGRIEEMLEKMQADPRLSTIEMLPLMNQKDFILESLTSLLTSGKIGAIFAVLVLFFFLRRFRLTLIITLSIPISILIALTAMFFMGESLNILSLLGLMISVGLLVDNSVVVAENIHRLYSNGMARREAVLAGVGEIALAVVMATLTTVIVFLPASLVEGQGQFFLLRLSMPICVSLIGSLLVALVFVPLAVYLTLPSNGGRATEREPNALEKVLIRGWDYSFGALNKGYRRLLGWSLHHRIDAALIIGMVFAFTLGVMKAADLKFVDAQDEERSGIRVEVEFPSATSVEEAEAYFLEVERLVESHAEEFDFAGWFHFHRTTFGRVEAWFNSPRTNDMNPIEITEKVMELMPKRAGVTLYSGLASDDEEETETTWQLSLYGEDATQLATLSREIEDRLVALPGVLGAKKSEERIQEELALVLDREKALRLGVDSRTVAGVVASALRGQVLPRYSRDGREVPVRVQFLEEDRDELAELRNFWVPTNTGTAVPISGLTRVDFRPGSAEIRRRDQRTSRTLTLELVEENEDATRENLDRAAAAIDLPEGVTRGRPSGPEMDEDLQGILLALALSVIFIYLLMAFLFESFILPLSIVFTIPLAFIGVVWAHVLTGKNIDFLGAVGVILLIGVVVNNGIVLIDYVNRLREGGRAREEALLLAAYRRFRPIMMTALTTICGMVPLLLGGQSSIGLSYTSFGLTLIGGLITSTLLTLLVVPVLYTLFEDVGHWGKALVLELVKSYWTEFGESPEKVTE